MSTDRDLLPAEELAKIESEAQALGLSAASRKEHSGVRMADDVREAIVAKAASGMTRLQISRVLKVSRNTVAQEIRRAEADGRIQSAKDRMRDNLQELCEDHLLRKLQEPGKMSALDFGIYFDKLQLLSGGATQSMQITVRREDEAAVLADLVRLKEGVIDIEATPVNPPMLTDGTNH